MIAVRVDGARIAFESAHSYDYVRWSPTTGTAGTEPGYAALTLFDAEGNRVATFYKWDGVDAGETP